MTTPNQVTSAPAGNNLSINEIYDGASSRVVHITTRSAADFSLRLARRRRRDG